MKTFNPIKATLTLIMLAVAFSSSAYEENPDNNASCEGNWRIELNTNSSSKEQKGRRGVWIPGTIYLDRVLAKCAKEIVLKQPHGGEPLLHGLSSQHNYELRNAARQPLSITGKNDYVLPVFKKQQVDLWVYIPGGRDLSPGHYQATLDAELKSDINTNVLQKSYSFDYLVTPYVRAKIVNSSDRWIQPAGTSVRVHLGDLTQRNRRDLPVYVESNSFVSMTVASLNQGNLVNVTNRRNKVPYQLLFSGQQIDLVDEVTFDINNRPFSGKKMTISFQNTAKPFARAGLYEDVVTISLYAR
ncbi:hypothetical protein HWQ46_23730 [Shewanella sp. D64]|uniref:hypothetical protein n=1 Tax=unclassified Shewanella TaxID=196818 RepID=UPI0022BA1DF5|nr:MULTISPECIES: hypothetical protein [unclassified Shewanella]MEC4728537.1 hypothetical protein [Shewanella sp. D64]MEC4740541.1 hypothetical protein [Shewanella sp. E94]WBJ94264.1 hypothetical protein HWQ47_20590 [Shewanella sp. MTB7]